MEERWTSTRAARCSDASRRQNGRNGFFEFFSCGFDKEAPFTCITHAATADAVFGMIAAGRGRVVFENKAHDFPPAILYWSMRARAACAYRRFNERKGAAEEWT